MKTKDSNLPQNEAMQYEPMLAPVTSDLYRTYYKSTGDWINECVCRNCAINIANDVKSEIGVVYDGYATYNFTSGEETEEIEYETCSLCEQEIPRGDKNGNYDFKVPDNIEAG